ncbi:glutamate--cysteine ligase [Oceaniserpentilla sp. 4NH20-0058]|uniref:glutamate--cysteine ligase n=1 Tax=Oceaniserpentilla sp. 4NH20-0058 TaxID=3127660 RepID=UPI00310A7B6C
MSQSLSFDQILHQLQSVHPSALRFTRGIEKEGLRVNADTQINQQPHPSALGSTLTHSSITTDYSEALLEFITPVSDNPDDVLTYLDEVQRFSYTKLDNQFIWPASMPGVIEDELDVPIAYYGTSNTGTLKHVYRHGLWHRYGRKMQCIAGLHYNFSVSQELWGFLAEQQGATLDKDFISQGYFGLIRNFRRYSWLLLYLFGASPALDASFLDDSNHDLIKWDDSTYYGPYATSLRMSGLGYQNNAQDDLFVCFNGLPTYTQTLKSAMHQTIAQYEVIGVEENAEYKQLNTNLLQIENEYYSDIRPKRNSQHGEKPLTSLNKYGVEYIEVRCLDLNPFEPLGIDREQINFLDLFLSYCLLNPSPKLSEAECNEVSQNSKNIVMDGRNPEFRLKRLGSLVSVKEWGGELLKELEPLAKLLDEKKQTSDFQDALAKMKLRVSDVSLTPSANVLAKMKEKNQSFSQFALDQAKQVETYFRKPLATEKNIKWEQLAEKSIAQQSQLECESTIPFAQYLKEYLIKE